MEYVQELQNRIEQSRAELNEALRTGSIADSYEKSVMLDELIEKYIKETDSDKKKI